MATSDSNQLGPRTKDLSREGPFGDWTVLRFDEMRGSVAYWYCRCACGLERSVKGASLTSGKSTKCSQHCPASFVAIDETGNKYGLLTVEKCDGRTKSGDSMWLCRCECGNPTTVARGDLRKEYGGTKSCGCAKKTAGGGHDTPEYVSWKEMKRRCYNRQYRDYHLYGGRGITVCERWKKSFPNFLKDMGLKPFSSATVDRIDNDGSYEPGNCRWATALEQSHNSRKARMITHNGITDSIRGWARRLKVDHSTIRYRLDKGWPLDEVMS